MLTPLLKNPPRTQPLIRIYANIISFNAPAAAMLDLKEGDSVSIMQDDRDGYIYVANCATIKQSYALTRRNNTFKVSSTQLCRKLAEQLEGFGTYRICQELSKEYMDHKFYNIFNKKYGKD